MSKDVKKEALRCQLYGVGAWGPSFSNWPDLSSRILNLTNSEYDSELTPKAPKPEIIPANERRRSPLAVKIAVETSWQAIQDADIPASNLACVFGSGLGDTEITDYMCRVLATESKQLSPTKFHNSVHNAAAGYWTISTQSTKAANSIAAYHNTAGLALLEGMSQCVFDNEPVLITLFDTKAHSVYQDIFDCTMPFSAALVIAPEGYARHSKTEGSVMGTLSATVTTGKKDRPSFKDDLLETLYMQNPAAKSLDLLQLISLSQMADTEKQQSTSLPLSDETHLAITLEMGDK